MIRPPRPAISAARTRAFSTVRRWSSRNSSVAARRRAIALAAMTCISGPPWMPGKTARSTAVASSGEAKMSPPRGPRSVLWVVVVTRSAWGNGDGWTPAATSPAMWAMSTRRRAPDAVGDGGQALEVEDPRVHARAGDQELRTDLRGLPLERLVVDRLGLRVDAVVVRLEPPAAQVHGEAVGEVPAVVEAQAQDPVAGREHGEEGGLVGLGTRVGLDVDVGGAREEREGALLGQALDDVDPLAAAVVAATRQPLGVLVREPGALGLHDRGERVVLAGDQLDLPALALGLAAHRCPDLGIDLGDRRPRGAQRARHAHSRLLRPWRRLAGRPAWTILAHAAARRPSRRTRAQGSAAARRRPSTAPRAPAPRPPRRAAGPRSGRRPAPSAAGPAHRDAGADLRDHLAVVELVADGEGVAELDAEPARRGSGPPAPC